MTDEQFREWFDFHASMFAGVRGWLRKMTHSGEVLARWRDVLSHVNIEEAKTASSLLFGRTDWPKSFDRHPAEILLICRKKTNQSTRLVKGPRHDGSVKCRRCLDEGILTVFYIRESRVFDRSTICRHVLDRDGDESELRHCCVRCDCGLGETFGCHPQWREFMLVSVGNRSWRQSGNWWQSELDNRPMMAGSTATDTFADLAKTGAY